MRRHGPDADENDIRARPGRRGSRPRTQDRPRHADAVEGFVLTVDRGRCTCLVADRVVTAMKARELGRGSVVVGDRVALVGDLSGASGTLARIVRVAERHTVLRRTADDDDPYERVVVANADQMAIVVALTDPEPRPRLIDRCLVAAYDAGLDPLLVLTKSDLHSAAELLTIYRPLGVPYVVTRQDRLARSPDGQPGEATELRERLSARNTVFFGHSGVGKTTLVNALVPDSERAIGAVNAVTGRGRHTTTSALALRLPDEPEPGGDAPDGAEAGWVIDTPGVRSFGLHHVEPSRVIRAFPDLDPGTADCPRDCGHREPDCALDAWVAGGHADPARLDSLRRLLATRERGQEERGNG